MFGGNELSALWPGFLFLLLLIPLLIAAYIWMLRRRRRFVVRYSSLSLVREALPKRSYWRRHVPVALFLAALTSLIVALARPVTFFSVPVDQTTIILAFDVSRSMCSTDILPNRFRVAQDAALKFIQQQRPGTRIGLVAFAGFAELIQPPTTDSEVLQDAIESLTTGRRTAIGSAILKSIDTIAEIDTSVAPSVADPDSQPTPEPVAKGVYVPSIIVLLTDGASNAGPRPVDAAQQAVDRGIRVYPIGFGTARGAEMAPCGRNLVGREPNYGGGNFGGGFGGGGGGGFRRGIDEETLQKVADATDGKYYTAESAEELQGVFESLPTSLIMRTEMTEVTFVFATIGALFAIIAIALALWWNPVGS